MSRATGIFGFLPLSIALILSTDGIGYAGGNGPDLVTDRPDQTESSETVRPGYVQFEFGWTHTEATDVTSDSFPETLVRLGLTDCLEFRFGFGRYIWEAVDGTGATAQATSTWGSNGTCGTNRAETAVIAGTTLPTGASALSSERFDPSVRLACAHTLTKALGLGYNVAANWATEEDASGDRDTKASVAHTMVLGIALTDQLGTFVELFGEAPTGRGKPANSLDRGFTYALAGNLQIDVLGGVGISEAADDWFVGAGLVWRLPQ